MLPTHRINLAQISLFTNFVYVSQTSNQVGTISMFTRSFLGKPRKRTRKQSRRCSMILGFSYINSQFIYWIYQFNYWINRFIYWIKQFNYWVNQSQYCVPTLSAERWQILAEISHTHMMRRTHPTPINFVFLFPKLTDGQLSLHKIQIVCTLYSFTSPRIEKLKFSYFGTYEQSYGCGFIFFR